MLKTLFLISILAALSISAQGYEAMSKAKTYLDKPLSMQAKKIKLPKTSGHVLLQQLKETRPDIKTLTPSSEQKKLKTLGVSEATGYIVSYYYYTNGQCELPAFLTSGIGTDVCLITHDETGNQTGSIMYQFVNYDETKITLNFHEFSDLACADDVGDTTFSYPRKCMNSGDADAEFSYSMSYTTDPEPWGKMDAGLVSQLYDNSAHCSEGGPMGIWNMITKDVCISDDVEGSSRLTACDSGIYTWANYVDFECKQLAAAVTVPLQTCLVIEDVVDDDTDDDYKSIVAFETQGCSA